MILEINPQNPQDRHIKRVVECLREGGVIVYPTDTTYGLGCDLYCKNAIERILAIKRMPRNKLLSMVCSDLRDISQYGFVDNTAYKIMKRSLPGPYTFVLKATKLVPKIMLTRQRTIGIRVPNEAISLTLGQQLGHPILSTSVRLPDTEEILSEPYEIQQRLGHLVDIVIDAGIILPTPSTVISLVEGVPEILREGKGLEEFLAQS